MTSSVEHPLRVLMTIDAVGGVWRYGMDLARSLDALGYETVFAGFGPLPSYAQQEEARALGELVWCGTPLDWMAQSPRDLIGLGDEIAALVRSREVDIVHLNLPCQAAGLNVPVPVIVVSHSCVAGWFAQVRGSGLPPEWAWQADLAQAGFTAADVVVTPSASHGALLRQAFPRLPEIEVVHNASATPSNEVKKESLVFAAGRWWDDGKNAAVLDRAAAMTDWPVVAAGATEGLQGQGVVFHNVLHRGALAHGEVESLMASAAVFVSPSIYEPFGLAALEAARSGAALVLSDIPTYRELWQDAALFVDPRNARALAGVLNQLSRDEALRMRMGREAQQRSKSYTLNRQGEAMDALYRRALTKQKLAATG